MSVLASIHAAIELVRTIPATPSEVTMKVVATTRGNSIAFQAFREIGQIQMGGKGEGLQQYLGVGLQGAYKHEESRIDIEDREENHEGLEGGGWALAGTSKLHLLSLHDEELRSRHEENGQEEESGLRRGETSQLARECVEEYIHDEGDCSHGIA